MHPDLQAGLDDGSSALRASDVGLASLRDARDTLGLACRPGLGVGSLASLGMGLRHQVLGEFTLLVF